MTDRITQTLAIIGATHQAESVISLLNGSRDALNPDRFHDVMGEAESMAWKLIKTIQTVRDDSWNAQCAEYEAASTQTKSREHA